MNSTDSATNGSASWPERTVRYFDRKGRLELATGLVGLRSLKAAQEEQQRNREAESASVRRSVWGATGNPPAQGDEMGDILGDVTTTHNVYPQPPRPGLLERLLPFALGAAGLYGLAAGGLIPGLTRPTEPQPTVPPIVERGTDTDTDTLFELRLGGPDE